MTETVKLVFSKAGILNPSQLRVINGSDDPVDVVCFGDGSNHALDQIAQFSSTHGLDPEKISRWGLGKSPLYDLRVVDNDGVVSNPNYVYSEEMRAKWFCANIAAPHVDILLWDISSTSKTKVKLDVKLKETICYQAYVMWRTFQVIEDKLAFPAIVLEKMTRWTQRLTPQTMDIELLRKETGIDTLDYHPITDLISLTIGEELYTAKLSLLNDIYSKMILVPFQKLYIRRLRIAVSIVSANGSSDEPVEMSYGDLGRILEGMEIYTKMVKIGHRNPMPVSDLIEFVKRVEINEQTCLYVEPDQTLSGAVETHRQELVRGDESDDPVSEESDIASEDNHPE